MACRKQALEHKQLWFWYNQKPQNKESVSLDCFKFWIESLVQKMKSFDRCRVMSSKARESWSAPPGLAAPLGDKLPVELPLTILNRKTGSQFFREWAGTTPPPPCLNRENNLTKKPPHVIQPPSPLALPLLFDAWHHHFSPTYSVKLTPRTASISSQWCHLGQRSKRRAWPSKHHLTPIRRVSHLTTHPQTLILAWQAWHQTQILPSSPSPFVKDSINSEPRLLLTLVTHLHRPLCNPKCLLRPWMVQPPRQSRPNLK